MRAKVRVLGFLFAALAIAVTTIAATSCNENETPGGEQSRKVAVSGRWQNFERGEALHPAPQQQNFPMRALLVEYTQRQDLLHHNWYTYVLGENGNAVYYFVSTTVPVNVCAFLSSTEDIKTDSYGNMVLTAPSYEAIYYGGAGASSPCNGWIVKDAATNAMGIIFGDKLLVFDQQLILDTEPVKIQIAPSDR